jgi:hypothetical protein
MNRIEELKQQNPHYGKSLIDILAYIIDKPKYVEMTIKLIKEKERKYTYHNDVKDTLSRKFGIPQEKVDALSPYELNFVYIMLDIVGRDNISSLLKFIDYNERKLISQNDISQYSSFAELETQLALAELKIIDKELQKQTQILLDTEEWLMLKPLSFEASLKYGASTKWCTAMKNDSEYFARYSKRGILIYCMNKLTGHKVAAFKNLDPDCDRETSFWNALDNRIDSMETDLPNAILDIIKFEFATVKLTNWALMPQEAKSRFEHHEKSYGGEAAIRDERENRLVNAVHNLGREEVFDDGLEICRDEVNYINNNLEF